MYRTDSGNEELDLSDRAYFVAQRDHAADFRLGAPIRSRTTQEWLLPATRDLKDADGAFDGIILGAVDPFFFVRVWSVDKDIPDQATALWLNDGTILIRSPFGERAMGLALKDRGAIATRHSAGKRRKAC